MSNNKDFKVKNGIQPTVYHEAVGTVVSGLQLYSISGLTSDNKSFSVQTQESNFQDFAFNTSGTKFYVIGHSTDAVHQYSMSTAWDISTASYDSKSFSVSSQDAVPIGIQISSDGTKVYVVGAASDTIYQYNLSTPFDASTGSYSGTGFSLSSQSNDPAGITFKTDGTKLYYLSASSPAVLYQYSLSTAWDLSTISYDSISHSFGNNNTRRSVELSSDGTKAIVWNETSGVFEEYSLSTAYDITTISSSPIATASSTLSTGRLRVKADGAKIYQINSSDDTIVQYSTVLNTASLDLSTGSVFDYTPTSDVQVTLTNPATSGTSSGATLLLGSEDSTGVGSTFSTTLYDGNGATQTITNDIDLAGDGGAVWFKKRSGNEDHNIYDTERGATKRIKPNTTDAENTQSNGLTSFNSDGWTMGSSGNMNQSGDTYASWTFKKQTKFFDIVTYTGDGVAGREIAHNLGSTPAVIITKNLNDTENWQVYHKDLGNDQRILLNQNIASGSAPTHWNSTTPTSTVFTVGTHNGTNGSGDGIVAYLFAHDTDASSLIQCGSYTGNGSNSGPVVNLGWEPQWLLFKNASASVRETVPCDWFIFDNKRGITPNPSYKLEPNTSDAEQGQGIGLNVTPTGFQIDDFNRVLNFSGDTFIYMAIRNPNIPTITYDPDLQWSGGTAPTAPATGETDVITFNTTDGGTTYKSALAIDGAK